MVEHVSCLSSMHGVMGFVHSTTEKERGLVSIIIIISTLLCLLTELKVCPFLAARRQAALSLGCYRFQTCY